MVWRRYISRLTGRSGGQDRRQYSRYKTSLSVLASAADFEERRHVLVDVSTSGALLSPNLDLPENVTATIRLAGGQSAEAVVVRQSAAGTAVRFSGTPGTGGLPEDLVNLARIAGHAGQSFTEGPGLTEPVSLRRERH